jgi:molybdate transport system substrate-binding protein
MINRLSILGLCLVLALAGAARADAAARGEAPKPILVFAAASLENALRDVATAFTKSTGQGVTTSFAGSSTLGRQIDEGAPAAVFISADEQWMNAVETHGLVQLGTRRDLLTNHLALIAPKDSTVHLKIAPWFPLLQALGGGRLAMADPAVPAGAYGQAALTKLGVWSQVAGQVARADNVRGALNFVARGEAPLGIVYDTDAMVEPNVRTVALFPDDTHPPILYPAALLKGAPPAAAGFLRFLEGPEAKAIFERYGFRRLL